MDLRRSKNISTIQKDILVRFMEENEDLRNGRFTESFTYRKAQVLWKQLAEGLNSRPGARKTWRQWRKTWHDIRSKLKCKQAMLTRLGNKPQNMDDTQIESLSSIEERIIAMFTNDAQTNQNPGINEADENEMDDVYENQKEMTVIKEEFNIEEHELQPEFIEIQVQNSREQEFKEKPSTSNHEIKSKQAYYKQKLEILRQDVFAKQRIATALEVIAEKLKKQ